MCENKHCVEMANGQNVCRDDGFSKAPKQVGNMVGMPFRAKMARQVQVQRDEMNP
jgi:hypothetical protein